MMSSNQSEIIEAINNIGLKPPAELFIMITTGCNLHCRHCWPKADTLSAATTIILKDFNTWIDNFIGLGVGNFCITGGEPLTHSDCKDMLAYSAGRDEVDRICLQTNGTELTKNHVAWMKRLPKEKIHFQISIEGASPGIHDNLRGNGSFEKTIAGLKLLGEIGLLHNVTLAFTEMQSNIEDLPKLLVQDTDEDLILRREVLVDRRPRHARLPHDVPHRRLAEAVEREDLGGRIEDLPFLAFRHSHGRPPS